MLEKVFDFIVKSLFIAGAILTIEEVVSVAYVGVQRSMLYDVALWCLFGSMGAFLIGGIILGVKEALMGLR